MRKADVGQVTKDAEGKLSGSLRTASHLAGYENSQEAIAALTPARRDAICAEIAKLRGLPSEAWHVPPSVGGVRG